MIINKFNVLLLLYTLYVPYVSRNDAHYSLKSYRKIKNIRFLTSERRMLDYLYLR